VLCLCVSFFVAGRPTAPTCHTHDQPHWLFQLGHSASTSCPNNHVVIVHPQTKVIAVEVYARFRQQQLLCVCESAVGVQQRLGFCSWNEGWLCSASCSACLWPRHCHALLLRLLSCVGVRRCCCITHQRHAPPGQRCHKACFSVAKTQCGM
jgi:hypothetical protein